MKKLILTLMMFSCSMIAQDINKLEQFYLTKAEALQAARDKDVEARDAKLAKDSKRLANAYLKSLKKIEIAIVQKGDLDAALKVRAKIKEVEAILEGDPRVRKPVKPSLSIKDPFVGTWKWMTKYIVDIHSDGTITSYKNIADFKNKNVFRTSSTWTKKEKTYYIHGPNYIDTLTIANDGKSLSGEGSRGHKVSAIRITDPIIGKWRSTSNKAISSVFKSDGTIVTGTITGGKWIKNKENDYSIAWPGQRFQAKHAISADGKSLTYKGNVFAKRVTDLIIGKWNPKVIGNGKPRTTIFDLKGIITTTGQYKITFTYTEGKYALVIDSVEFLRTGIPIAKDVHEGWAGHPGVTRNNTYVLKLKSYSKGTYKLRVKIYGDLGLDSSGNIYLERIDNEK